MKNTGKKNKEEYKCIRLQCGGCRPIWSSIYPGNPAVHWVDIQSPASIPAAHSNAQCAVGKVYFSAQPNNLKPILNCHKYYPI